MTRQQLARYLREFFQLDQFPDYGPNGLQVQGKEQLAKLAFAVSATRDSVKEAIAQGADAIIVHHGLFWNFHGPKTVTGPFYHRLAPLLKHDINLFALHIPLDAHLEVGNAKSLADRLQLAQTEPFGDYQGMPTGVWGKFASPIAAFQLAETIGQVCNHPVIVSAPDPVPAIGTIGIITGGANGDWSLAHQLGLDAYLTGEISEHDWHEARESGIVMYAAGHHATEQFGIQSLMAHLQRKFSLECFYIDSPNPA